MLSVVVPVLLLLQTPQQAAAKQTAAKQSGAASVHSCAEGKDKETLQIKRGETCSKNITLGVKGNQDFWIVRVIAPEPSVLLTAQLESTDADRLEAVRGGGLGMVGGAATELPARTQLLLLQGGSEATLQVTRHDTSGPETAAFALKTDRQTLTSATDKWFVGELSAGHAQRVRLSVDGYRSLSQLGQCIERDVQADEDCLVAVLPSLPKSAADFNASSEKDKVSHFFYNVVSSWVGRSAALEFGGAASPSASEPMVLFIGIAGVNRVILLDCHRVRSINSRKDQSGRECYDYARPSGRTLQRAEHFWAVYAEDEDVPFSTSIDVEFKRRGSAPDYEEYDPQLPRAEQQAFDANWRRVRIAWRRFRTREAPSTVQVAFSRQGSGYGLRQWIWTYNQYNRVEVLAGAALVGVPAVRRKASVERVFSGESLTPEAFEVTESKSRRAAFLTASLRFAHWRGRGHERARHYTRLMHFLTPDITVGVGDARVFLAAGSFPVPLWRDRLALLGGVTLSRDRIPPAHLQVGSRLATSQSTDTWPHKWTAQPTFGLMIDFAGVR